LSCIYCNHCILYKLKNRYYKCAKCKRKFSPKKLEKKAKILKGFLDFLSPTQIGQKYNISYATVVKEVQNIRKIVVNICEEKYLQKENIIEFNEYLYIPKTLKKNKDSIYKAKNFLTINYDDKIYNIMLSNMQKYKNLTSEEIKSFFIQTQITNLKNQTILLEFWNYFEEFIKKYKGIKDENFIFYLKEAEFRFNKFKIEVKDIL
jgi:transposase